jgi:hypothetical protein
MMSTPNEMDVRLETHHPKDRDERQWGAQNLP